MDCYNCKFRGTVPGSVHSSCNIFEEFDGFKDLTPENRLYLKTTIAVGKVQINIKNELAIKLDPHGVKNGWAIWPYNFDPIWIEDCKFKTDKTEKYENVHS